MAYDSNPGGSAPTTRRSGGGPGGSSTALAPFARDSAISQISMVPPLRSRNPANGRNSLFPSPHGASRDSALGRNSTVIPSFSVRESAVRRGSSLVPSFSVRDSTVGRRSTAVPNLIVQDTALGRSSIVAPPIAPDSAVGRISTNAPGRQNSEERSEDGVRVGHTVTTFSSTSVRGPKTCVGKVVMDFRYQGLITVIIMTHFALSVHETDIRAKGEQIIQSLHRLQQAFICVYCGDLVLRLINSRWQFFSQAMDVFDLVIVMVDFFAVVLDWAFENSNDIISTSLLRGLRVLRILRVLRKFVVFRDLYLMIKGMTSSIRAIFFATLFIFVVVTCFSIVAVEVIHPINSEIALESDAYEGCDRCYRAFSSVWSSNLTFLQTIMAGDSWGVLAIPLIEKQPWTAFILFSVFMVVELGLMNVIVAVVVDRQAQAREDDKQLQTQLKEERRFNASHELLQLFKAMDEDNSGQLTEPELMESFYKYEEFRETMHEIDVQYEDLPVIFRIMDKHGEGTIGYQEFVHGLHSLKTLDIRTLLFLTREHTIEAKQMLQNLVEIVAGAAKLSAHGLEKTHGSCSANGEAVRDMEPKLSTLTAPIAVGDGSPCGKVSPSVASGICDKEFLAKDGVVSKEPQCLIDAAGNAAAAETVLALWEAKSERVLQRINDLHASAQLALGPVLQRCDDLLRDSASGTGTADRHEISCDRKTVRPHSPGNQREAGNIGGVQGGPADAEQRMALLAVTSAPSQLKAPPSTPRGLFCCSSPATRKAQKLKLNSNDLGTGT